MGGCLVKGDVKHESKRRYSRREARKQSLDWLSVGAEVLTAPYDLGVARAGLRDWGRNLGNSNCGCDDDRNGSAREPSYLDIENWRITS
jgi:hypothetical protein